jgi:uncharacterized coiled-coil protein SlyX
MTSEPPAEQNVQSHLEGSAAVAPSSQRLSARLQRLEQQIRAFKELHVAEVTDLAQRLHMIAQLHADELQLILDEVADIEGELAAARSEAESRPGSGEAATSQTALASPVDPAASSPKRAKWLAEEERRARPAPVSRRELLLGRGEDPQDAGPGRGAPQ